MRISWLIPLAALALASCQAREPQAPGRPGDQAAAPPAATTPVPPPPTLEPAPRTASGPDCCACPPANAQAACPPARRARAVRRARPAAQPQRIAQRRERGGEARRDVDIPPYGGYRYQDLEDREIERRYAERRYDAERYGRHEEREADAYREPPPPPAYEDDDRPRRHQEYRQEDRYSGGRLERRRESEDHHEGYAHGGRYEHSEGYVERRAPEIRREAQAHGGVRRYEERSYEESSRFRESYRESGGGSLERGRVGPCCARPAEAAGRDANGFLTWPGKVPAIP